MAAKFCKETGDYATAIEFLILAKRPQEAKELAQQYNKMDVYTELVVDETSKEECLQLARYYETMGEYGKSGTLLERCGESSKALKLYLQWSSTLGIQQAVELVGRDKSGSLFDQLLEYLHKEGENPEKNLYHLYEIYKVVGNYEETIRAASTLARKEQDMGNYKKAHELLLDFCLFFQKQGKQIPVDIFDQFMLLHSYVLAKIHICMSNHRVAARLLIRVANEISKFPAHMVPILTSTVLECHRSGLNTSAFEFASMLMQPDYRNKIAAAYKRKVENILRKSIKVEEEEILTPCPMCGIAIPDMQLTCPTCNSKLPFCIASGQHMVLGNWSICPHCKFPALITEFLKVLGFESLCPMCSEPVAIDDIQHISDPLHGQKKQQI